MFVVVHNFGLMTPVYDCIIAGTKVETWGKCIVVFALNHFKRLQAFYRNQLTYITTGLTPVKQLIDNGWLQKQDRSNYIIIV